MCFLLLKDHRECTEGSGMFDFSRLFQSLLKLLFASFSIKNVNKCIILQTNSGWTDNNNHTKRVLPQTLGQIPHLTRRRRPALAALCTQAPELKLESSAAYFSTGTKKRPHNPHLIIIDLKNLLFNYKAGAVALCITSLNSWPLTCQNAASDPPTRLQRETF